MEQLSGYLTIEGWYPQSRQLSKHVQQCTKEWKEETKDNALPGIFPTPSHKIIRIHKAIKRARSSLITQIRIEEIGLKAFLYDSFVLGIDDESCMCGARSQTAHHVLQECRLLGRQRREWWPNKHDKDVIFA